MEEKLEQCPFCKRIPKMWDEEEDAPGGPVIMDQYLQCKCGVRMYGYGIGESALIKKWNTRV